VHSAHSGRLLAPHVWVHSRMLAWAEAVWLETPNAAASEAGSNAVELAWGVVRPSGPLSSSYAG
jgi:hypothetical protein